MVKGGFEVCRVCVPTPTCGWTKPLCRARGGMSDRWTMCWHGGSLRVFGLEEGWLIMSHRWSAVHLSSEGWNIGTVDRTGYKVSEGSSRQKRAHWCGLIRTCLDLPLPIDTRRKMCVMLYLTLRMEFPLIPLPVNSCQQYKFHLAGGINLPASKSADWKLI